MTDQSGGPIGAARRAAAEREARAAEHPPGRHTAATITDDELDALYDRVDFYEAAAKRMRDRAEVATVHQARAEQRAEQAEAAIARVRAVAEQQIAHGCPWSGSTPQAGEDILTALDEPQEKP